MEDYRENAQWLTSEDSISRYRSFAAAMVPIAPDFDYESPMGDLMFQFLDGAITAEQFADQFAGTIQ